MSLLKHGNNVHYLTTLKGVMGMLRNPEHTESVFDIEDGLRDIDATGEMIAYLRTCEDTARMMDERWLAPESPDLDALSELPEGTLGKDFAHHILSHGYDPDYYRKIDVKDDTDYVMMRIRQTHDIWHVVTGFDVSRIGEVALKAFELGQMRRPMAAVICAGGVIRFMMKDPDEFPDLLNGISMGYRLGLGSKKFLGQKWEEHWDRPVAEWRELLGVERDAADPSNWHPTAAG
ncbi:MAG: Coq4 family protein [Planctomycetota bacterium]